MSTPYQQQEPAKAPAGTKTNTPWIWLIAVLPAIPVLGILFIDWREFMLRTMNDPYGGLSAQLAIYTSPGYLIAMLGGWAVYGLCVFFAYRDWRVLQDRDVPRPFHWAFAFLGSIVYVIGRSVVVRSRTGRGAAGPILASVGMMIVAFIVVIVMMISMFSAIFTAIPGLSA